MRQTKSARQVKQKGEVYILKLYVADNEQNSRIARENLKKLCDEYLKGQYEIEEVDILVDYAVAMREKIFVTPTLSRVSPEPRTSVVGNLNDKEKVVSALGLRSEHEG